MHHLEQHSYQVENEMRDVKIFAMLIYILSFFTSIIGPLILFLLKRSDSTFIDRTGKNYFNFVISYTIHSIAIIIGASLLSGLISLFTSTDTVYFTLMMFMTMALAVIGILSIIFKVVAIVKAYQGRDYLPSLSYRFFK